MCLFFNTFFNSESILMAPNWVFTEGGGDMIEFQMVSSFIDCNQALFCRQFVKVLKRFHCFHASEFHLICNQLLLKILPLITALRHSYTILSQWNDTNLICLGLVQIFVFILIDALKKETMSTNPVCRIERNLG